MPSLTYFFQPCPASYFLPSPNNAITWWTHRWIALLIRSEASWSNQFPKHCIGDQDFSKWVF
jgi:hypothetical protein